MIGKRFLLIVGGAVGGLGVVVSVTPPQFGSAGGLGVGGATLSGGSTATTPTTAPAAAPTNTPATAAAGPAPNKPTKKSPKGKVKHKKSTTSKSSSSTSANSTASTPPAATAAPAPASTPTPVQQAGATGVFNGSVAQTQFGPVQVQITVKNGKITNATALTYPTSTFRDQQINQQAIPYLIQETLQAQSSSIQGVGGASYTSQGWYESLVSALAKAGMK